MIAQLLNSILLIIEFSHLSLGEILKEGQVARENRLNAVLRNKLFFEQVYNVEDDNELIHRVHEYSSPEEKYEQFDLVSFSLRQGHIIYLIQIEADADGESETDRITTSTLYNLPNSEQFERTSIVDYFWLTHDSLYIIATNSKDEIGVDIYYSENINSDNVTTLYKSSGCNSNGCCLNINSNISLVHATKELQGSNIVHTLWVLIDANVLSMRVVETSDDLTKSPCPSFINQTSQLSGRSECVQGKMKSLVNQVEGGKIDYPCYGRIISLFPSFQIVNKPPDHGMETKLDIIESDGNSFQVIHTLNWNKSGTIEPLASTSSKRRIIANAKGVKKIDSLHIFYLPVVGCATRNECDPVYGKCIRSKSLLYECKCNTSGIYKAKDFNRFCQVPIRTFILDTMLAVVTNSCIGILCVTVVVILATHYRQKLKTSTMKPKQNQAELYLDLMKNMVKHPITTVKKPEPVEPPPPPVRPGIQPDEIPVLDPKEKIINVINQGDATPFIVIRPAYEHLTEQEKVYGYNEKAALQRRQIELNASFGYPPVATYTPQSDGQPYNAEYATRSYMQGYPTYHQYTTHGYPQSQSMPFYSHSQYHSPVSQYSPQQQHQSWLQVQQPQYVQHKQQEDHYSLGRSSSQVSPIAEYPAMAHPSVVARLPPVTNPYFDSEYATVYFIK